MGFDDGRSAKDRDRATQRDASGDVSTAALGRDKKGLVDAAISGGLVTAQKRTMLATERFVSRRAEQRDVRVVDDDEFDLARGSCNALDAFSPLAQKGMRLMADEVRRTGVGVTLRGLIGDSDTCDACGERLDKHFPDDTCYDPTPTDAQMLRFHANEFFDCYRNVLRVLGEHGPHTAYALRESLAHSEQTIAWTLVTLDDAGIVEKRGRVWGLAN